MKHYILVNPASGKGKSLVTAKRVKALLEKHNIKSTIIVSEYPKHLTKVAKELASKSKCRFYSVGGDGTLNEVASGIAGTSSEIVVIPSGTGNDFLKSISKYSSMRKIINTSIHTKATPTDILKINNNLYCINILSVGFDAMVAENIGKFRKLPLLSGKAKYTLATLYTLAASKNFKLKLHTESIVFKRHFTLIVIANGKYYGGGIMPCPHSNPRDGFADICAIESTGIMKKLMFLPAYSNGSHVNKQIASFSKSSDASIVSTRKFPVNIDGEIFYTNRLHVRVIPNAVNVVYIDKKFDNRPKK